MEGSRSFLNGKVVLHAGDCLDVISTLPDASIDSVVTDPPYALTNRTPDVKWCVDCTRVLGGREGKPSACPKCGGDLEYQRSVGQRGFMGKAWDTGEVAFAVEFWAEVLRVLRPGAHVAAFGGTRTYHRLVCAIEDAGFEIRDQLAWLFGSGFPKSHDVSKGIDKAAGAEREIVGSRLGRPGVSATGENYGKGFSRAYEGREDRPNPALDLTAPATDAAGQWQGWGTALKPAHEPIVLARKPLIGTVAANVLAHGTGGLNVDACRVGNESTRRQTGTAMFGKNAGWNDHSLQNINGGSDAGRFPANLVHDGSPEVEEAFAAFGEKKAGVAIEPNGKRMERSVYGGTSTLGRECGFGDTGSASRFFYSAKAAAGDRIGSKHPTVKPVHLMQWLVRLVTPPGGTVLDPFAGTGTTGAAAWREGFRAVLIEREAEYQADIERRMALEMAGPDERLHARIKARGKVEDAGPLFGGLL